MPIEYVAATNENENDQLCKTWTKSLNWMTPIVNVKKLFCNNLKLEVASLLLFRTSRTSRTSYIAVATFCHHISLIFRVTLNWVRFFYSWVFVCVFGNIEKHLTKMCYLNQPLTICTSLFTFMNWKRRTKTESLSSEPVSLQRTKDF